jgi:hypothetical protein
MAFLLSAFLFSSDSMLSKGRCRCNWKNFLFHALSCLREKGKKMLPERELQASNRDDRSYCFDNKGKMAATKRLLITSAASLSAMETIISAIA